MRHKMRYKIDNILQCRPLSLKDATVSIQIVYLTLKPLMRLSRSKKLRKITKYIYFSNNDYFKVDCCPVPKHPILFIIKATWIVDRRSISYIWFATWFII